MGDQSGLTVLVSAITCIISIVIILLIIIIIILVKTVTTAEENNLQARNMETNTTHPYGNKHYTPIFLGPCS